MTIDLLCVVLNIGSLGFLLVIACFQVVVLSKKFFYLPPEMVLMLQ